MKLSESLFLLLALVWPSWGQECTRSGHMYENYLGTKTPYRVVANYNSSEVKYEGCEARKIWALVRHGTRNPSLELVEVMRSRLSDIRDLILENLLEATEYVHNSDLDLFRAWSSKLQDKDEKKLTHEGEDEMLLLAERMQGRFPGIFTNIYSESAYHFKFTATQRTRRSAQYFTAGLFGRNTVRSIEFPEPLKRDPILRFYKLCNKWRKEVKKNPEALFERNNFVKSDTMKNTLQGINHRLGFTNELKFDDVHAMYMACAFETAWNKRKRSPWCSAFTVEDLVVMEYSEDLKYYWVDGYGYELTYKQACPAFGDMIDFFESQDQAAKATVYFTHSGTLLKMLAHLELYKDSEPLIAKNYGSAKTADRKWRVSYIDSFGTNLALVLFNCGKEQKVLGMHQERVVRLPACPDQDLCDLEKFKSYYEGGIECAFDAMCDNE